MYKFVIIGLILILFSVPSGFGEEQEMDCPATKLTKNEISELKTSKMKPSTSKMLFIETNSVFYTPPQSSTESFQMINISNETAIIREIVVGELIAKEQPTKSTAPEIISTSFSSTHDNCIKMFSDSEITITRDSFPEYSGTWTGKILVLGYNFEPVEIELELIVKHEPIELIGFTIFGISIAIGFGFFMTWHTLSLKKRNTTANIIKEIDHLNDHVQNINKLRNYAATRTWEQFVEKHNIWIHQIETDPSKIPEGMEKEYVNMENSLKGNSNTFENELNLTKIKKPEGWDPEQFGKVPREELQSSNFIFALIAIVASVPLSLFTTDYFIGIPAFDVIIAMGIGFSIYRTKDLGKIIKSIYKPEES